MSRELVTLLRPSFPAVIAGFTVSVIFLAVLGIMLAAAGPRGLDLTDQRTSGWIAIVYGLPMLPSIVLTLRHRIPLLLTGNLFAIIFFVSLGDRVTFPELSGAAIVAGVVVLATALLGVTGQLAGWIPAPIVHGLIAGAVLPFVIDLFSALGTAEGEWRVPAIVASALVAFLVSQRSLGSRIPPILPAFVVGSAAALLTGELGTLPTTFDLPGLEPIAPAFSLEAIATVSPVLIAVMTLQANLPSAVYLRSQGFEPPERVVDVVSGAGTVLGSLFGPMAMSLALPPLLVTAGPTAGERSVRYRSVFVPIAAGLLIAVFAATAADLSVLLPPALLFAVAGLALVPAFISAIREAVKGPLVLGPVFAFATTLSEMSVAGLGRFFWALVLGTVVSFLFERDGWQAVRSGAAAPLSPP